MNSFFKFLTGFSKRITKVSGLEIVAHSPIVSWGKVLTIVGVLIIGILIKLENIEQAKLGVLNNHSDYSSHLALAAETAKLHDYEKAEQEILLAKRLMGHGIDDKILGSDTEVKKVSDLVYPVEAVENEVLLFESIAEQRPWYRDVLLRLTVLNWQLNRTEESEAYFNEAEYLDPNNETVQIVGELISR